MIILNKPTGIHDLGKLFFNNDYIGELEKLLVKVYFDLHKDMEYVWPDKDVEIEGTKGTQLEFRVPDEFDLDGLVKKLKDNSIVKELNKIIDDRRNKENNKD